MWYLELCRDNGAEYTTEYCGLFKSKEDAEAKAKTMFSHLKILKFVDIVS